MERRCHVQTLAEFDLTGASVNPKMTSGGETDVLTCTDDCEVHVYSTKEMRVKASD